MLPIDDHTRVEYFDAIFVDWLGGQHVYHMLIAHQRGLTYREIASQHGVSVSTAHTWIGAAKVKMRRCGLNADFANQPSRTTQHAQAHPTNP